MKTKITILAFISIIFALGLSVRRDYYHHKEPAPGYCVVSDDASHFFVKNTRLLPGGFIYQAEGLVGSSKQEAINLTWRFKQYDERPPTSDNVNPVGELHDVDCGK
jgi:hypothetical protein